MSARKAEPALREACDLLYAAGWDGVCLVGYPKAKEGEPAARLDASANGSPRQSLTITRTGDAFMIERFDGVHRVGKPIEATGAGALTIALAAQAEPTRRK